MAQNFTKNETLLDKMIKLTKIFVNLIWLIIGIIALISAIQLYQAYKSGQLSDYIQQLMPRYEGLEEVNFEDYINQNRN